MIPLLSWVSALARFALSVLLLLAVYWLVFWLVCLVLLLCGVIHFVCCSIVVVYAVYAASGMMVSMWILE